MTKTSFYEPARLSTPPKLLVFTKTAGRQRGLRPLLSMVFRRPNRKTRDSEQSKLFETRIKSFFLKLG